MIKYVLVKISNLYKSYLLLLKFEFIKTHSLNGYFYYRYLEWMIKKTETISSFTHIYTNKN